MPVIVDNTVYIAVGQDPEHGEAPGHLYAIDATLEGDITEKGKKWHYGNEKFGRTLSSVAVADGLVYAVDLGGNLNCLDAKTGQNYWVYEAYAAVWGSPMVMDGKIYLGDEDGDVAVLKQGKEKVLIGEYNMGTAVYTTPVAKNGVIYIATRENLYAIANKK
jgi:outer membrane protein assembly factor BamB